MIEFRLMAGSGVATYVQLVQQVRQALRLGVLRVGDQLPTVREVVVSLAINPNTVARAYRELEAEGLVEGRQGQGTFCPFRPRRTRVWRRMPRSRRQLEAWMKAAVDAGLDQESMVALFDSTLRGAGRLEGAA